MTKLILAFAAFLAVFGFFFAGSFGSTAGVNCDDELDMDCMKKKLDPKQVEMHQDPLPGLKLVSSTGSTATVEWPAVFGGIKYTVYYIVSNLADVAATVGKEVTGNPNDDGTAMRATIENLTENVSYDVYVNVERDNAENNFLALFKTITVPGNRA